MLQGPKKTKFKKEKRGKLLRFTYNYNTLTFGTLGLKAKNSGIVNAKQIEAARKALVKKTKKKIKIWTKIFLTVPITRKSTGVRMGKGKGPFSHWGSRVKGGTVIFEVCGTSVKMMVAALKAAGHKLPITTKIFN